MTAVTPSHVGGMLGGSDLREGGDSPSEGAVRSGWAFAAMP